MQSESNTNGNGFRPAITPLVDVYENDDEILVVADLPGARPESVDIKFEKDQLSISAKRDGQDKGTGQILFGARHHGEYQRTFLVPRGIDAAQITADMNEGVLRVHLPKSSAIKPRTIAVKSSN